MTASWLWIALIGFLVLCCIPMLFAGKRHSHSLNPAKEEHRKSREYHTPSK